MAPTRSAVEHDEQSPLVRLFSTKTHAKLVDAFLSRHYLPLAASDLAEVAGIDQSGVSRYIDDLVDYDVVEPVETEGRAQHYQLNKDDEAVEHLMRFKQALVTRPESDPVNEERKKSELDPREVDLPEQADDTVDDLSSRVPWADA